MAFTAPPARTALSDTYPNPNNGIARAGLGAFWDYVLGLLGSTGNPAQARAQLGIDQPQVGFAVGSSALTITLTTPDGTTPAAATPLTMAFRSATLASGAQSVVSNTAAISTVISSGSTGGASSATDKWFYLYAMAAGAGIELAWCGTYQGRELIGSTTAEGGVGAADSAATIYSTTARTGVAMKLVAAFRSNQTTAGTWAAVPVETRLGVSLAMSGPWTPVLSFAGASVGITGTIDGKYTYITPNLLFVQGRIFLSSKGSSTGAATIQGLPAAASYPSPVAFSDMLAVSYTGTPQGHIVGNGTNIALTYVSEAGTQSNMTNTNFANNSQFEFSAIYPIAG